MGELYLLQYSDYLQNIDWLTVPPQQRQHSLYSLRSVIAFCSCMSAVFYLLMYSPMLAINVAETKLLIFVILCVVFGDYLLTLRTAQLGFDTVVLNSER